MGCKESIQTSSDHLKRGFLNTLDSKDMSKWFDLKKESISYFHKHCRMDSLFRSKRKEDTSLDKIYMI